MRQRSGREVVPPVLGRLMTAVSTCTEAGGTTQRRMRTVWYNSVSTSNKKKGVCAALGSGSEGLARTRESWQRFFGGGGRTDA